MEKITAIICVLNEEKTIRNVILSIQAFSIVNEIIIVNDGSTDNGSETVKQIKDSRVRLIQKENGGVCSARNVGIKNSKYEYLRNYIFTY